MKYQITELDILEVGNTSTHYGHEHKGQRDQFQHFHNDILEMKQASKLSQKWSLKNYI
jgi:hypothetical protein